MTARVGPGSRHLVDPELDAAIDLARGFELSAGSLQVAREMQASRGWDRDPVEQYPEVTRTEHRVTARAGEPDVRVLFYEPLTRSGTTGALVWIHGGGYVLGSADGDEALVRRLVTETGVPVASVDYRLAPETSAPGQVEDCYAALRWVHERSSELSVDPARVAVGGASAGGGLAACLAILARDRDEVPVAYQLLIYPMLDDRTASTRETHDHCGEFVWTPGDNRFGWASLLGHEPGIDGVPGHHAAARVDSVAGLPPTFLCVGALDLFLEEDMTYAGRLLAAGIPTELHVYPGVYHGHDMNSGARVTAAFFRDLTDALDRALNG